MRPVNYKLGKHAPKNHDKVFKLSRYLKTAELPHLLHRVNWVNGVANFGMMKNDVWGCCTISCIGHLVELWTMKESNSEVIVPDSAIQQAYVDVTGSEGAAFNPVTGANDNGCAITDVLAYCRNTGVGGHKIDAYASVNPLNSREVMNAAQLFGGIDIGVNLPLSAQSQVGQIWDVPAGGPVGDGAPGSWGGHCVPVPAYVDGGGLTCITWGALQQMTWAFFNTYCDEAYAIISPEWVAKNGANPAGFDLALLQADLAAMT